MSYNKLTPQEKDIIEDKGTEAPFTGEYDDFYKDGRYICKKCNASLFSSESKFNAHLGHEFKGEHLTEKDTRHCVNSLSIRFIPSG